jgi:WD40 repeat protein
MMRFCVPASLLILVLAGGVRAQQPPSYARQVKSFLARYCLECHNADKTKGELNLETYKHMLAGGKKGVDIIPGKPDESRLVMQVEKKQKPHMPPEKAKQPTAAEVAVLRAWVAAGARDDSSTLKIAIPDIKPRSAVAPAVAALAYHPDGKRLAAGLQREVVFIDVASGDILGKLPGQGEQVTALAFSRDGKTLAVASGAPSVSGELRIYPVPPAGLPAEKPAFTLPAHKDEIFALAFSPDNNTLASSGYDRLIRLWDVTHGKQVRMLKDHSDTVYGLAFNQDGSLLASASADRAVKVWETATGRRLYTLAESTDWLYSLVWSPDGKHLAAAGVDQSIRVWAVNASAGKLVHSAYAHEAPVVRLAYSADGKTIYSLGEDRALKSWDTATMRERMVYAKQAEAPLSLAVRPDQKQLAVGRYDGVLVLLDEASGKVEKQPLPARPKPPQVTKVTPNFGVRGATLRVRLDGQHLDATSDVVVNHAGVAVKLLHEGKSTAIEAEIKFPAETPSGAYTLTAKNAAGESKPFTFFVDPYAASAEQEPNDTPGTGQKISLPATLAGSLGKAGDIDFYRFDAKEKQEIGVQVVAAADAKFEPVLQLLNSDGKVVAEGDSVLGYVCPQPGTYMLGIRDREFRGGGLEYRLHVGDLPVVTAVFPLGMQRGTRATIQLEGVNLVKPGFVKASDLHVPAETAAGTQLTVPFRSPSGAPLGNPRIVIGEFPEVIAKAENDQRTLAVPGTGNGRILRPGATDTWTFPARKGQRLIVEVHARRLGTPLDSFIEILDDQGKPVPRATLRCVARTYTTFRDHDSAGSGIRIETWNDFAMKDYVLVGDELLRIRELPKNPDDDCQFFSASGQRVGQLDTTPTHHAMGVPMYKVAIHPPGATFPPNGLPVVNLFYRNDDGGSGYGKDSRIFFDPPADGTYRVRIGDSRNQGGPNYAYRLTVRPPRPSYTIGFNPTQPSVWRGGAIPITVTATRIDGFDGAIDLKFENLPAGFSAPSSRIGAGDNSTAFALWADADAKNPTAAAPKIVARATIDGHEVVREAVGQLPRLVDPGDIVTATEQPEVTIKPGSEAHLTVKIDRKHGFTGRVPVEVRGLPYGVRVLDIGLNGILVIPGETQRTLAIYCEPWVEETVHPFVVLARQEGKNSEHAAKSVLLRVKK